MKKGDAVIIRTDLKDDAIYNGVNFLYEMRGFLGKTLIIKELFTTSSGTVYFSAYGCCWKFSPEMTCHIFKFGRSTISPKLTHFERLKLTYDGNLNNPSWGFIMKACWWILIEKCFKI